MNTVASNRSINSTENRKPVKDSRAALPADPINGRRTPLGSHVLCLSLQNVPDSSGSESVDSSSSESDDTREVVEQSTPGPSASNLLLNSWSNRTGVSTSHPSKKSKPGRTLTHEITPPIRSIELSSSEEPFVSTSATSHLPLAELTVSTFQAPARFERVTSKARPPPATTPCALHPVAFLPLPRATPKNRPRSPDWSRIPRQQRPLQGRERPGEFSTELQKTWIIQKQPDLSTPLGHLIFTEEINSNQMWENPEIPRIDVLVPDNVKERLIEETETGTLSGAKSTISQSLAPPLEFIYTDRLVYRTNERPIPPSWHCNCHGDCLNNPHCECRAYQTKMFKQISAAMDVELADSFKNFEGFAYTSSRRSRHSHAKKPENEDSEARHINEVFLLGRFPVFECNSQCGCGPDCINRTVGRGRREKLSIEKTISRGWGVVADHSIPTGRLVTHYSGELITDAMSIERGQKKYDKIGRTYLFNLDPWWINTLHSQSLASDGLMIICEGKKSVPEVGKNATSTGGTLTGQNPNGSLSTSSSAIKKKPKKTKTEEDTDVECIYSVDAFLYGNISRFINHSCNANTVVVPVYIEDSDPTRPIFAMFANKMIKTGKEITTSYSDPNPDEDEKFDRKHRQQKEGLSDSRYTECRCGAPNCRGIMFA